MRREAAINSALNCESRAPAWHLCLVLLVSFAFLFASMSRAVKVYDEGLVLFGALRVSYGDVPYRDFYANYGPA